MRRLTVQTENDAMVAAQCYLRHNGGDVQSGIRAHMGHPIATNELNNGGPCSAAHCQLGG